MRLCGLVGSLAVDALHFIGIGIQVVEFTLSSRVFHVLPILRPYPIIRIKMALEQNLVRPLHFRVLEKRDDAQPILGDTRVYTGIVSNGCGQIDVGYKIGIHSITLLTREADE